MLVERGFGMLKGMFKILFQKVDIPMCQMLDMVTTCICLHNMCIATSNGFDMDWVLEVQREAHAKEDSTFGNIKGANLFKVVEKTIKQMKNLQNQGIMDDDRINMEDIKHQNEDEDVTTIEKNPSKKAK
jgi:hypothetical protein